MRGGNAQRGFSSSIGEVTNPGMFSNNMPTPSRPTNLPTNSSTFRYISFSSALKDSIWFNIDFNDTGIFIGIARGDLSVPSGSQERNQGSLVEMARTNF